MLSLQGPADANQLRRMTDSLRHRGPDGEGWWFSEDASVGLGHRRLAIIDLSDHGSQPMQSLDGRYCLVYNGEIYNYQELRADHLRRGIRYRGDSDTEVLLNHYALLGPEALTDLDGMFAFAIWDKEKRELFCARDRFGEKPFYYMYEKGRRFLFASEIKALFAAGASRNIDHRMLYAYFRNQSLPQVADAPGGTFYENICKLPSATFLRLSDGRISAQKRYWSVELSSSRADRSLADDQEEFRRLFFQSVSRRLRSDVPVGSSLSGGIDSSAIVCAIPSVSPATHYNTFSARFDGFESDEGEFIDQINAHTGSIANSIQPSADDLARELADLFYFQDEPVESTSAFGQWSVMKLAKARGVIVLLDGQGGDEIAAGYHAYFAAYLSELSSHDSAAAAEEASAIRDRLGLDLSSPAAGGPSGIGRSFRGALVLKHVARRLLARTPLGRVIPATTFLSRSYFWEFGRDDRLRMEKPSRTLNQALRNDLIDGKFEQYLRFADRNSMAHSREVRLPFLSHELVEFMFSVPARFKISHGWTKYLVRESLRDIVPEQVLWRKEKVGFATPQKQWMGAPKIRSIAAEAHDYLVREGVVNKKWSSTGGRDWDMIMAYLLLNSGDSSVVSRAASPAARGRSPSALGDGASSD